MDYGPLRSWIATLMDDGPAAPWDKGLDTLLIMN